MLILDTEGSGQSLSLTWGYTYQSSHSHYSPGLPEYLQAPVLPCVTRPRGPQATSLHRGTSLSDPMRGKVTRLRLGHPLKGV